jgi:peptidyl-prolyl cis-trans isomerase C
MSRAGFRKTAIGMGALLACCAQPEQAPAPANESLPEGVVARVGDEDISTELVSSIARAQATSPAQARDAAISDALWACYARERFAGTGRVPTAERSALARSMLEGLRKEVEDRGPPTDEEVEEVTALRWQDVARPALARVVHAVVLIKKPEDADKAKRVADRLADALRGVSDEDEFEKRARAVDAEGMEIKVERLLPVAPDGRMADPGHPGETQRLEVSFAQAAHAIANVGDQSPVVRSSYGLHVILLVERLGERMLSLEQRRRVLEREIVDRRAQGAHQKLLEEINKTTPVLLDRAAADLLQQVRIVQ